MLLRLYAVARALPLLAALAGASGCSGGERPAENGTPAAAVPTEAGEWTGGDPLLAQARQQLQGTRLPDEVREKISASSDPAHARARRILAVMDRQARGEAEPEPDEGAAEPGAAPSAPSLVAPPEGAAATNHAHEGGQGDAAEPAEPADSREAGRARLAVLTRLSLAKNGQKATLTIHAADALRVGVAAQASGTVRLVVESAGALPAVLQARPSMEGLSVSDVRRGQDTVQIAIELGEGWTAGRPISFAGGARMTFTRT
jgi:hypothetical protein